MAILEETESMHDNPKDDIQNIDQSYDTLQISLAYKTQEKHGHKVLTTQSKK